MLLQALKKVVIYCILSPYGEEQSDLIHRVSKDRKLEKIPTYKYVCWYMHVTYSCIVKRLLSCEGSSHKLSNVLGKSMDDQITVISF